MPEDPAIEFKDGIFPDSHQVLVIYLLLSPVVQGSEPNPRYVYEERGEKTKKVQVSQLSSCYYF